MRALLLTCAWAAVQAQESCVDDPTWAKRGDEPWKDCAWVREYIPTRCSVRGADGREAREACPRACEELCGNQAVRRVYPTILH